MINSINQKAEQLYQSLQDEMLQTHNNGLQRSVELESLFTISRKYWALLQSYVAQHEFETLDEEVHFFKIIKPKFISEILYCGLLGHALFFKTSTQDPTSLERFWNKESQRLKKFSRENFDFWVYYKEGRTDKDSKWFTRKNEEDENLLPAPPYDMEEKASSGYDGFVSNLLALERYEDYIKEEMKAPLQGA